MDDKWREPARAAAEKGLEILAQLIAQLCAMVPAAAETGEAPLIRRGLKLAAFRTLRMAEALARRIFCAMAFEMEAGAGSVPASRQSHLILSPSKDEASKRAACLLRQAQDEDSSGDGRKRDRRPAFALFEHTVEAHEIIVPDDEVEAWLARRQAAADRERFPCLDMDEDVSARGLIGRLEALEAAMAQPEEMARRLLRCLSRGRHAGKLYNISYNNTPRAWTKADPVPADQIVWLTHLVRRLAGARVHAIRPAPS